MSDYDAERIEKPPHFRLAPLRSGRSKRTTHVIGYDSEADTTTGEPMLLQLSPPGADESESILLVIPEGRRETTLGLLLDYVARFCTRKDTEYLIYGFNLEYEFTQLYGQMPEEARLSGEFSIDIDLESLRNGQDYSFNLHVMNDRRYLTTINNAATHRQVRLLDAMSFYKTSLGKAAKMLHLGAKLEDDKLDRTAFTRGDLVDPTFLQYASQDAYITRRVGDTIVDMHVEHGVSTCISAPHFASKVYRRKFLDGVIEQPGPELEQAGLWSYHGGKNGFYLPGPMSLQDVWAYDITSAYPEAMRQLPDPVQAEWQEVDAYAPGRHAIYRVSLRYRRCAYRGFMDRNGQWPASGYVDDAYMTSYELDAMIANREARITSIHGWVMTGPSGGSLVNYVDTFFAMKADSVGPKRETAKLFLNSLYGKFFQKVALGAVGSLDLDTMSWVTTNPDAPYDWRAGGLYHPPIASLITGYVRAKIHGLEHRYGSVMTSTDGLFGRVAPDADDLGAELGKLTAVSGALRIWRERLYIFDTGDHPAEACEDDDCKQHKVALHGFRGGAKLLATVPLEHGVFSYTGRQMVTLKLSTRGLNGERYEPGRFVDRPFQIAI